jgi:hypothetical protein
VFLFSRGMIITDATGTAAAAADATGTIDTTGTTAAATGTTVAATAAALACYRWIHIFDVDTIDCACWWWRDKPADTVEGWV